MQSTELFVTHSNEKYDVIVVGSGITGGWASKEFTERGFKTLMVERGRKVEHRKDYVTEGKGPWQYPNRTKIDNLLIAERYKEQSKCYAFDEQTKHFFGDDRQLPYSTSEGTGFSWIRGNQLGGKSLTWARQCYRMSDYDFNANKADGYGNDWPIRYKDLESWYSYVEKFAGISGGKDNLPQLPDGEHLPPFEMMAVEKDLKKRFAEHYPERPVIMGRCAHLSKPTQVQTDLGRIQCQARDECQKGCSFGAYFSTQSATLPAAAKTGNLSIATDAVVHSLIYDEASNRVKGVRIIDANTHQQHEYFADIVFLCASTLGSTQILLNSKTKSFPNGLANSSGVLGHYLMDHCYNAFAGASIEGFEDEYYQGRRPTGLYFPNFQFEPSLYKKNYLRGYAMGTGIARGDWKGAAYRDGIGKDYKDSLTKPGGWGIYAYAQGEMLPRRENQVSLHETKKDAWGIPQLHFECKWSDNERLMMEDAADEFATMFRKIGLLDVYNGVTIDDNHPGLAIHEVGTARMGRDPKESVLNSFNQCHDIPNLFVTDGASYCSVGTVNPSLTFMALTARAVDYAAKESKQRRL